MGDAELREIFGSFWSPSGGSRQSGEGASHTARPDKLELGDGIPGDKVLQLRVDLQYAQPTIWRRLLLPSSASLADLHIALQLVFGWEGSHLHAFEMPEEPSKRLGRTQFSDPAMGLERAHDEYEYSVGQLLCQPKDRFFYEYDFGDCWRHEIVLEKILDSSEGQAVQCTAGRMRAPVDDIGGLPGWYHALDVMNNPSHPDYEHVCHMLALEPGETLDPNEFDAKEVDVTLRRRLSA